MNYYKVGSKPVQRSFDDKSNLLRQSWVVPVVMVMPNSSLTVWVEYPEHVFTNPGGEPIKLNFGGFGYYYTNYSESLWLSLAQELQENLSGVHYVDRIDLLKSVYHQISESSLRYDIAFEMFKFLENETDDLVWAGAIDVLESTRHLMRGYARDGFKKFGQQLIKNYYGSIHWTKAALEKKIFNFACSCDLEECLTFAGELFKDLEGSSLRLADNDVHIAIAGMKTTTDAEVWNKYWTIFDNDPRELHIFAILMTSKDPTLLEKVLERLASNGIHSLNQDWLLEIDLVDPSLFWILLSKELSYNHITESHSTYMLLMRYLVDPKIAAGMLDSTKYADFYVKDKRDQFEENSARMTPAEKWLIDNGYLQRHWEMIFY